MEWCGDGKYKGFWLERFGWMPSRVHGREVLILNSGSISSRTTVWIQIHPHIVLFIEPSIYVHLQPHSPHKPLRSKLRTRNSKEGISN